MQIHAKLTIQFSILVALILFITLFSVYELSKMNFENRFYERLENKAYTTGKLLLEGTQVDTVLLKRFQQENTDNYFGENIEIYNELHRVIYTNNDTIDFKFKNDVFSKLNDIQEIRFSDNRFDILGIQFKSKGKLYYIFAGGKDQYGKSRLASLKKILVFLFCWMTCFGTLVGWGYSYRALKPINKVIYNVQNLSSDLKERLEELNTQDEIGKLVSMFNKLLLRIEQSFETQKTFITNVSHELKNPLTKITSQLEVTLLSERSSPEYKKIINSILDDIKELNQLSISLLELASLENNNINITVAPIRVDQILWELRDSIEGLNNFYSVEINSTGMPADESDLFIVANLHLIKIALGNLMENACKFSNNGKANISLNCNPPLIKILVEDNGIGISDDEAKKIFQPFYRADNTFKTKGHGIGLSLSKRIIELHNGTLEVISKIGLGTTVIVTFTRVNKF